MSAAPRRAMAENQGTVRFSAAEVCALHDLRRRHACELAYPWFSVADLRRLEFLRYYYALHGRPAPPEVSPEAEALGRRLQGFLAIHRRSGAV